MQIGLYFGSFNPIHIGHLILANYIKQNTTLNEVWFVVSPQNPLKPQASLLNEYQRIHLVKLALEGTSKLKASDIEFKLPKPSYTIDTLTYLSEKYPNYKFTVIMGSDSYNNLPKWKNWEILIEQYNILIYQRPGFVTTELHNPNNQIINAPLLEISSTVIREMLKKKQSIKYLVTDSVLEEIEKSNYYKS